MSSAIRQPQSAPPSLTLLKQLVQADLARVNDVILHHVQSEIPLIRELSSHLIQAGGKRVRPSLTLASAMLCDYEGTRHVQLAACVEFIHTATLLHDDVVDASDLRRGEATANAVWGNKSSVLVGDFLLSRAFQLMVADGSLEVLRILSNAAAVIAAGEVKQLVVSHDLAIEKHTYLEVIEAKTAELFAAAAELGAVVAGRPSSEQSALRNYGNALGIAFQLIDDALDYQADATLLGKAIGDDFREGKVTLPVMLAYQQGTPEERAFWEGCLEGEGALSSNDLLHAKSLLERSGALAATYREAEHYACTAREALSAFAPSSAKEALLELVDFCVARAY